MTENDIRKFIIDYLALDGWRHIRTDPVSDRATVNAIRRALAGILPAALLAKCYEAINKCVRGKGFGETGMADDLFIRYHGSMPSLGLCFGDSQTLWIEAKRPRTGSHPAGVPSDVQVSWHRAERARGALTLILEWDRFADGTVIHGTPEDFRRWYAESGLARRVDQGKSTAKD